MTTFVKILSLFLLGDDANEKSKCSSGAGSTRFV